PERRVPRRRLRRPCQDRGHRHRCQQDTYAHASSPYEVTSGASVRHACRVRDTVIFIPAWNEAASLPALLEEARRELPEADLLVIDDGSTDETAAGSRAGGGPGARLSPN